jgi:hypothetical protein
MSAYRVRTARELLRLTRILTCARTAEKQSTSGPVVKMTCPRCEREIGPDDETDVEVAAGTMRIVHDVCPIASIDGSTP